MKKALVLQGWYQKPNSNWYPWLKKELEKKKYTVHTPDLPTMHTDIPDMQKQLAYIRKHVSVDANTIIFGHSLGCLLAMRIAQQTSYRKMFLIAGWDFNDLSYEHRLFWQTRINHTAIKKNVKEIYCISSDNDPYITAFTAEEMSKRLGGKFILVTGAGHFTEKDGVTTIPKIIPYL